MKTHFKKMFAGLLAVSAICCTPSLQAFAASPNVSAVTVKSYRSGNRFVSLPTLPAKSYDSSSQSEKDLIATVKKAADYFNGLGFNYNNTINYYNPSTDSMGTKTTNTVYVGISDAAGAGNATSEYGLITIGPKGKNMNELYASSDAIAHEYTHLVTQQLMNWSYKSSSDYNSLVHNAIIEGYSDILGELSETRPDWKMGTNLYTSRSYCIRDLSAPNSTKTPYSSSSTYDIKYYTRADDFKKAVEKDDLHTSNGNGGKIYDFYTGSTVISHAAYLMYSYGVPRNVLADIWFKSLGYYTTSGYVSFEDCRRAVTRAAHDYLSSYSSSKRLDYMYKISEAFDSAHIYINLRSTEPLSYTTLTQSTAANTTNMNDFMRASAYKYPNGYYWATDDVNTAVRTTVMGSNGITIGPTFKRNYDNSYDYQYQEPYYQCAGFARKLQNEYFQTPAYLQIEEDANFKYIPRIGDHLRVKPTYYTPGDAGHSIFITSVSQTSSTDWSFTYCDCNANGNDKIAYNKKGTVSRKNGNLSIKLGSTSWNYAWVERPAMVGDVNGDSYVNSNDVIVMQRIVNNNYYSESYSTDISYRNQAADLNKNGRVDSSDLTLLKNAIKSGVDYIGSYNFVR